MLHLVEKFLARKHVGQAHGSGAVQQRERHAGFRVMLPGELEHQQFVEIGIEEGPNDGVQFPVVVVRPLGEVDDHRVRSRVLSRVLSSVTVRGKATAVNL